MRQESPHLRLHLTIPEKLPSWGWSVAGRRLLTHVLNHLHAFALLGQRSWLMRCACFKPIASIAGRMPRRPCELTQAICTVNEEVKRILVTFRPRGSQTILRFERKVLTIRTEGTTRFANNYLRCRIKKGLRLEGSSNFDPERGHSLLTIRFAERPNYPRHNRKNPQE